MRCSFHRFATDKKLAGHVFTPTHTTICATIKAALAEPLAADERLAIERILGGRDLPVSPVSELVIAAGRCSGKTQAASAVIVYMATCREWPVAPGQVPVALLLAADREQAQVAFRFTLGLLESSPILKREIESTTREKIVLRNGVEIHVATSDYKAVRGRSIVCAVADELAFWQVTAESANPDSEVLVALRPGLARFRNSLLVCISSVYAQRGALHEFDRRYYGQNDARVLMVRGATRDFNPTFPAEVINDALVTDPAAASAEYLSIYRSDLAAFIDAALLDSVTRSGPRELPRLNHDSTGARVQYVAGLDVSGGRGDATAAAIAHKEGRLVIVDPVRRWPAPHDPQVVAHSVREFFALYGVSGTLADQYGADLSKAIYANADVSLAAAPDNRSDTYLRFLNLLTTSRVELPPEPVLRSELLNLERRTRSGRDIVDHRPGAHDDVANAVALAAVALGRDSDKVDIEVFSVPSESGGTYFSEFRDHRLPMPWKS